MNSGGFLKVSLLIRRTAVFLLIVLIALPADADAARRKRAKHRSYAPTAKAAILLDVTSGRVLYSKNSDGRVYPASTTKVMTALLALERLPLDKYLTVSRAATQVMPTKLGALAGDQYRVKDLLFALLLNSSNDAAVVLAEGIAGSHERFVAQMNQRARRLGARHTRFANAHGLPREGPQYTTARDMALIFKEALKNPVFRNVITFKYRIVYSKSGRRHFVKSHNKALFLNWKRSIFGKTGFTLQAKSCFVGQYAKGGRTYIIAVFGCRKRWQDIKFIVERYGRLDL